MCLKCANRFRIINHLCCSAPRVLQGFLHPSCKPRRGLVHISFKARHMILAGFQNAINQALGDDRARGEGHKWAEWVVVEQDRGMGPEAEGCCTQLDHRRAARSLFKGTATPEPGESG